MKNIKRHLKIPLRSFFLFGPRGTGKSTWLKQNFNTAVFIDLLDTSVSLELQRNPNNLEAIVGNIPENSWIVIDEIQKIPILLDEVHRLIEKRKWKFAISGSSARKLKREGVNLLGGRALTRKFFPFSFIEVKKIFQLMFTLEWGNLPLIQLNKDEAADILSAYVNTYIKEEIREEGIIRKLNPFIRFLTIAGMMNGNIINLQNIAREASIPRSSVDSYFSILEDTLLASFLPAYRPNIKVREQTHPKLFWFDPGVARAAAGLLFEPADRLWLGYSLETIILHEIKVYNQLTNREIPVSFYRTQNGTEIDFIIETRKRKINSKAHIICIEIKLADKWQRKWENPIRTLKKSDKINIDKMIGVYTGKQKYDFEGFVVFPIEDFLNDLHSGKIY